MNGISNLFALGGVAVLFAVAALPALADAGQRKLPAPVICEPVFVGVNALRSRA